MFYLFAIRGPGNSVVILDDAPRAHLFIGGAAAIIAVAFLPSAWMREPGDGCEAARANVAAPAEI